MITTIIIRTRFVAFHCWPEAPDVVAFLRNKHRHEFWVEVELYVEHTNRDLEFFICKDYIDSYISNYFTEQYLENMSCEGMATALLVQLKLPVKSVSVFEDGENGAKVEHN